MKTNTWHLVRWAAIGMPAIVLNGAYGFSYALVWMAACTMIMLSVTPSVWRKR